MEELGELWDVSASTISKWIRRFDIRTGGRGAGNPYQVPIDVKVDGYVRVQERSFGEENQFMLHRLIAVAEFGFDEVLNKEVHHKNGVPWDNRPSNLELLTTSEHARLHAQERDWNEGGGFAKS